MTALILITVGLCALWVLAAEGVRRACVRGLTSAAPALAEQPVAQQLQPTPVGVPG